MVSYVAVNIFLAFSVRVLRKVFSPSKASHIYAN